VLPPLGGCLLGLLATWDIPIRCAHCTQATHFSFMLLIASPAPTCLLLQVVLEGSAAELGQDRRIAIKVRLVVQANRQQGTRHVCLDARWLHEADSGSLWCAPLAAPLGEWIRGT